MRRMQALVSTVLVVSGMLLAQPVAVSAQGLNDVLTRILSFTSTGVSNCHELGGPGNTTGNLAALCPIIPNSGGGEWGWRDSDARQSAGTKPGAASPG